MDAYASSLASDDGRAIRFAGSWREYLPIAATNALLIICTLGVYRFWASARQRRYLWSRTEFIDDTLEWTGTGKEMFLGFLIVIAVLAPFVLFIQFLFPALIARGKADAAFGVIVLFEIAILYLGGFARFRALRYRLSRTYWHGIRGGSDDPGWNYGGEYLGRLALSFFSFFIVYPWAATQLWNSRWNAMSFGPLQFRANVDSEGLKGRWALVYLVPLAMLAAGGMIAAIGIGFAATSGGMKGPGAAASILGLFLLFYLAIPLMTLNWYAAYYRRAASVTSLGELEFAFDATTLEWLGLFLGNLCLAVVTLGFGITFWGYRNWTFMVRHLHAYGTIDVSALTQSTTHAPREAEGFADAFDVGAI
ncbi:MAG TPA: YjgN family protein [Sphingomicrobium sp.]|nr:YjgN family protein [Sphingomicrobium sp.]